MWPCWFPRSPVCLPEMVVYAGLHRPRQSGKPLLPASADQMADGICPQDDSSSSLDELLNGHSHMPPHDPFLEQFFCSRKGSRSYGKHLCFFNLIDVAKQPSVSTHSHHPLSPNVPPPHLITGSPLSFHLWQIKHIITSPTQEKSHLPLFL